MKVLLTGATGFIGQHVARLLKEKNIDFITIGRTKPLTKNPHINADLLLTENFEDIISKAKVSHLIHLAWFAKHGEYWSSPYNADWIEATIKLTESFCKNGGKGIVMAGSCAEYDWSYETCNELSTPANPKTIYGKAKNKTRKLVFSICEKYHVPCSWGRLFFPFGANENPKRLIPSLISVFLDKRPPFGVNVNAYRDFLYVSDAADAFIFLLLSGCSGIFNISSGKPVKISYLVDKIANYLDANPEIVNELQSERPDDPNILVGDEKKLRSLGWSPTHDFESGLQESLKHFI